jgi:hypothetical protein
VALSVPLINYRTCREWAPDELAGAPEILGRVDGPPRRIDLRALRSTAKTRSGHSHLPQPLGRSTASVSASGPAQRRPRGPVIWPTGTPADP